MRSKVWHGEGSASGFAALALALALSVLLMFGGAHVAFAAQPSGAQEPAEEGPSNLVDPQQRPDSSFIYDTLISDLAEADSYYNGQTVQVTGEAVGDNLAVLFDEGHRWITLQASDASFAQVTVYMTADAASAIDTFGAYGKTGSTVQVRGVFNLACNEHEGLSDIHAEYVNVVKRGSVHPDEFVPAHFAPGLMLALVAGILVFVYYRLRERRR